VSLKAAIRPNREGHIFDYFCVVGYPPAAKVEIKASAQARRQEPVILYQYPEDNQLNEQVVHFCFPNGTLTAQNFLFLFLNIISYFVYILCLNWPDGSSRRGWSRGLWQA
jgi:hypothetical protein